MAISKPFYVVRVDSEQCAYVVSLNDCPLFDNTGFPITTDIPCNLYMNPGPNVLRVRLTPLSPTDGYLEKAACAVSLAVRPGDFPEDEPTPLVTLTFRHQTIADDGGIATQPVPEDPLVPVDSPIGSIVPGDRVAWMENPVTVTGERSVAMASGISAYPWHGADRLVATPALRDELVGLYQAFWQLLAAKDAPRAMAALQPKIHDLAIAYDTDERTAAVNLEMEDMLASTELTLLPFKPEKLVLEVFGEHRLARLVDKDGDYPIAFLENDGSLVHYIPIIYCRTAAGWHIVR